MSLCVTKGMISEVKMPSPVQQNQVNASAYSETDISVRSEPASVQKPVVGRCGGLLACSLTAHAPFLTCPRLGSGRGEIRAQSECHMVGAAAIRGQVSLGLVDIWSCPKRPARQCLVLSKAPVSVFGPSAWTARLCGRFGRELI